MISECIKQGMVLANRNIPLVFIRIFVTILNVVTLFIFLGVPVIISIAYLGFDWEHAQELLPFFTEDPMGVISKYLSLIFVFGVVCVFYAIVSSLLFLYVLGGTLGSLTRAARNGNYTFILSSFFKDANKNFSRLIWLGFIILLMMSVIVFILFVFGGIVIAMLKTAGADSTLEIFFNTFISVLVGIFSLLFIVTGIVFVMSSVIALVVEGRSAVESMKAAADFIKKQPQVVGFYLLLLVIVIGASAVFYGLQIPFQDIPSIGPVVHVFMYLISFFFQGYLSLFMWSALISYYMRSTRLSVPVYEREYDI